ncbi:MAG: SulP family inorganic anion transporter [Kiritimatiellia bacterium]
MSVKPSYSLAAFRGDLWGGLTTAIISLPMALAFGVASGAGPQAGLYGAVMVGFWAAVFGGSRTLISEPTGPMTLMIATVMTGIAARYPEDALAMMFAVIVLAGIFQMAFGLLKLGRYITLMPYSVISGFMSGIGVLLMILQIAPLLGHAVPPGGAPGVIAGLPDMLRGLHLPEFLLGVISLVVLFAFPSSWRRKFPPQLAVLIFGTIYAAIFFNGAELRIIGAIPMGLPSFQLPMISMDMMGKIFVDALLLAMLGSIDTVLTAMIADSLSRNRHDTNRELVGQGIANTFSGFFGGLPGAGATMGTVVNIQSGASTRVAGMTRALILLVVIMAAAPLLTNVPMVILAAITFKVGLDILDWSFLRRAHRVSRTASFIMYGVLAVTVLVDIMVAVGVGVFIANIITIDRLTRLQSANIKLINAVSDHPVDLMPEEKAILDAAAEKIVMLHFSGPMIFGVARSISLEQDAMRDANVLVLDLTEVSFLSVTVALALENVIREAAASDCVVIIAAASDKIYDRLKALGLLGAGTSVFTDETRSKALCRARDIVAQTQTNTSSHDEISPVTSA